MIPPITSITVGELKRQLAAFPDDYRVSFLDGSFTFQRLKQRDSDVVQLELHPHVWRDKDGSWHFIE